MHQFFEFLLRHWELSLAFIVILALIIRAEMSGQVSGIRLISAQDATLMLNREKAVLVDIRDDQEYKVGHIASAISVPHSVLEKKINKFQKYKNKTIILYCQKGEKATTSGTILRKSGYQDVCVLKGGIQAWQEASLPLVT